METIYLCLVIFLLCLAVFDLFVGVSNDAVNFLQSAIGARVARYRTILTVASIGVVIGAVMSSGMMDVARHGIMLPANFSFLEVMTIFLAVMVTDILVLDVFNTLGMPTSTTVSLVFDLLGGTFALATIKIANNSSLDYNTLINSSQALKVIIAIFMSVAVAFVFGCIVMWISRVIFTFNFKKHERYTIAIFGGIAFTALAYFIFLQGLAKSPYISSYIHGYIINHTSFLLICTFIASTLLMEILHLLKINIFKLTVLMGTFALAMAFAGNDLVNFIGVPLAGLDSFNDYAAHAAGANPASYMMTSLMGSAKTPPFYLLAAGAIMIVAMATSKKAKNVIKTSVDLARQDEGEEMFGSSKAARAIVRYMQNTGDFFAQFVPGRISRWINTRFNQKEMILEDDKAAFDVVRAAVNLVLASMLITIGTNYKLPLSTTYVTFMVAMGSSLVDRAWGRESAVFRVTGVLSVIGGWFITAGVAFITCALVCTAMYYGGIAVQLLFIALVVYMLLHSNKKYNKKQAENEHEKNAFRLMMRTHDPELVWNMLQKQVSRTQSFVTHFALDEYNKIIEAFEKQNVRQLNKIDIDLREEQKELKKYRHQEMLVLRRSPIDLAIERNTWFHLGANSDQQFLYTLRRMLEPIKEHVDNSFNPLPETYIEEYEVIRRRINDLMKTTETYISTNRYDSYRTTRMEIESCKKELSILRKKHIDRIQQSANSTLQVNMVYLNLLQESQEFLSNMKHQLRAAKKFME